MTDKTFNKVEPLDLRGDFRAAWLLIPEWRINVCAAFDYADAIALQDWLAAATGHFPQREGWVLVPREQTPSMIDAGCMADTETRLSEQIVAIYRAMLAAVESK